MDNLRQLPVSLELSISLDFYLLYDKQSLLNTCGIYANSHILAFLHLAPWKQIYEAIKAHLCATVIRTKAHTDTGTHDNPAKCRALHILFPPSTHGRQMFSVILHLFLQHTNYRGS